jgi:hypothetical protein
MSHREINGGSSPGRRGSQLDPQSGCPDGSAKGDFVGGWPRLIPGVQVSSVISTHSIQLSPQKEEQT